MNYQLHNVHNDSGRPAIELIDEGFIPPQGSWAANQQWLQNRINELRQSQSLQQVLVWSTRTASEGAFIGLEMPDDHQCGQLHMLVKD
jgi:hypothetical protein